MLMVGGTMPPKHEDLGSNLQHPCKKSDSVGGIYNPGTVGVDSGGFPKLTGKTEYLIYVL